MTACALDPTPILSLEPIDDQAVVPRQVRFPFLTRCNVRRECIEFGFPLGRHREGRWSDLDPVEILVKTIEKESEELLRIVLLVAILYKVDSRKIKVGSVDSFIDRLKKRNAQDIVHVRMKVQT